VTRWRQQIAAPDDAQRGALEALRGAATAAGERLAADCPQEGPTPPWARLEAVQQAIDAATVACAVQPARRASTPRWTTNRRRAFCAE
jgi:hypothetical protein